MKRTYLSGSLLGLALASSISTVYAGGVVMPPQQQSAFGISLTGLYLQPTASNLDYAVYTEPLPTTTPNWTQHLIKPGYKGAFDLGLQYLFGGMKNQVSLDWLYFSPGSYSNSATASGTASIAPPYYFGPLAQALRGTFASGSVQYTVNNINLVFGHFFDVMHHVQIEPFAGLSAAYLKQNITSTYLGSDTSLGFPYSIVQYNKSKFTGAGPRLGLNMTGLLTDRFSIIGSLGTSILVGSMDTNTNFLSHGGVANTTPAYTGLADISQTTMVPEVDGKLALNYTVPMNGGSSFGFQVGYTAVNYFSGINQVMPTALVPGAFNTGTIAIETSAQQQSNLGLNGPYASITWIT